MARRKYKSGSRWALWRWTDDVESDEYITRLHVVKTPWFAVCLHWINGPDPEPYLHDHPVSFLSLVLRGGYEESRYTNGVWRSGTRLQWNYVRASERDIHAIRHALPGTVTLCFMGPKTRDWGYHTERGWVGWRRYYAEKR